ncbi:hypothetical protein ACFOY2_21805 [Nonomuraea purpurea]|uniref:CU044_5270 family protein n=1 Tax=Nonomuraea purpurea TaxID=1849276 RepID=A0ABV8G9Z0_9ACTN
MTDDLIRDLYGTPKPDPDAQARVWRRVAARRRRRRLSWLSIPAVVAAVAIVFAVVAGPARQGRAVLMSAATTAAATPADGAYWYIKKERDGSGTTELWASRDGRAWTSKRGRAVAVSGSPFTMAGREMTFEQIERLPADPDKLKAAVTALLPPNSRGLLADALAGLLWSKPSPPAIRAAAYQALADLPEVSYVGESSPGEAFSYTLPGGSERIIVIDPKTSQVLSCTDAGPSPRVERVLEAGWTDKGPDLR